MPCSSAVTASSSARRAVSVLRRRPASAISPASNWPRFAPPASSRRSSDVDRVGRVALALLDGGERRARGVVLRDRDVDRGERASLRVVESRGRDGALGDCALNRGVRVVEERHGQVEPERDLVIGLIEQIARRESEIGILRRDRGAQVLLRDRVLLERAPHVEPIHEREVARRAHVRVGDHRHPGERRQLWLRGRELRRRHADRGRELRGRAREVHGVELAAARALVQRLHGRKALGGRRGSVLQPRVDPVEVFAREPRFVTVDARRTRSRTRRRAARERTSARALQSASPNAHSAARSPASAVSRRMSRLPPSSNVIASAAPSTHGSGPPLITFSFVIWTVGFGRCALDAGLRARGADLGARDARRRCAASKPRA